MGSEKQISSKYFYDDKGSEIFEKITRIPEYYLTSAEHEIIQNSAINFFKQLGREINLIELGAGVGDKTKTLLNLISPLFDIINYHAFDISQLALKKLKKNLESIDESVNKNYSQLDFEKGLEQISLYRKEKNVILFLGSSIGNMTPNESVQFLQSLSKKINKGDIWLIGFDLIKNKEQMELAYNDPYGLTRDFNLNLLERINCEMKSNFNVNEFSHVEYFDEEIQSMVSFLESKIDQKIIFPDQKNNVFLKQGERIRTEYSFKYNQDRIVKISREAGLTIKWQAYDSKKQFTLVALEK